jgi:hypothetical protein
MQALQNVCALNFIHWGYRLSTNFIFCCYLFIYAWLIDREGDLLRFCQSWPWIIVLLSSRSEAPWQPRTFLHGYKQCTLPSTVCENTFLFMSLSACVGFVFVVSAILTGRKWYLIVLANSISLTSNDMDTVSSIQLSSVNLTSKKILSDHLPILNQMIYFFNAKDFEFLAYYGY